MEDISVLEYAKRGFGDGQALSCSEMSVQSQAEEGGEDSQDIREG